MEKNTRRTPRFKNWLRKTFVIELPQKFRNYQVRTKEGLTYNFLPYDDEESNSTPVEFLKHVRTFNDYYSVEYHKNDQDNISIRHWTREDENTVLRDLLPTNFSNSKSNVAENSFIRLKKYLAGAIMDVSEPYFKPIIIYDTNEFLRSRGIFTTLSSLNGEYLFQVLMHPAPKHLWYKRFFRDNLNPFRSSYHDMKIKLSKSEDEVRESLVKAMTWKVNSNFPIQTQVRVIGTSNSKYKLKKNLEELQKKFTLFSHSTKMGCQLSLKLIRSKRLLKLLEDMVARKWHYHTHWVKLKEGWRRKRPVFTAKELANFVSIPRPPSEYNIKSNRVKPRKISPSLKEDMHDGSLEDFTIIGVDSINNRVPIFDFDRHIYISGKTGMGKSTLMENIVLDKAKKGKNIILFDPHGELAKNVIDRLPLNRLRDIIYIGQKSPIGFNALKPPGFPQDIDPTELTEMERIDLDKAKLSSYERTTNSLLNIFKESFGSQFFGPQNEEIFEFFTQGLLHEPKSNFTDFYHLLTNKKSTKHFSRSTTKQLSNFIHNTYLGLRPDQTQSTINKIGKVYRSRQLTSILSSRNPVLEIKDLLKKKRIVIINLSRAHTGEDRASFIASVMINMIWNSIVQREILKGEKRNETYLFADEIQIFNEKIFNSIVSEGRKYKLNLVIANQQLDQLSDELVNSILGNTGTLITMNTSERDGHILNQNSDEIDDSEFKNLNKYNALIQYTGKSEYKPVLAKLYPPRKRVSKNAELWILKRMRKLVPDQEYVLREAYTPRWTTEDEEDWLLLINILKRRLVRGKYPTKDQIEDEVLRSNLKDILKRLHNKGTIESNKIMIQLTPKGKDELLRLIGRGTDGGKVKHRRMILRLYEILTLSGLKPEIVRQVGAGIDKERLPDMVCLPSSQSKKKVFDTTINVEVENTTMSKPSKVLINLEKAMKQDKKVWFFVENEKKAEKLYRILSDPYPTFGRNKYYKLNKRTYDPEKRMKYHYWKDESEVGLERFCSIFIFDHENQQIDPFKSTIQRSSFKTPEKGYVTDHQEDTVVIEEKRTSKLTSETRKSYYKKIEHDSDIDIDLTEEEEDILKQEYFYIKENTQRTPDLRDLGKEKSLIYIVESLHCYNKEEYSKLDDFTTTTVLKNKLEEKRFKVSKRIGRSISLLAKRLNIESKNIEKYNQKGYLLLPHLDRLDSLYKLFLIERLGEGDFSFPEIFFKTGGAVSFGTVDDLFEKKIIKIDEPKGDLEMFKIQLSGMEKLFKNVATTQKSERSLDYFYKNLDLSKEEIRELLLPEIKSEDEKTVFKLKGLKRALENIIK